MLRIAVCVPGLSASEDVDTVIRFDGELARLPVSPGVLRREVPRGMIDPMDF